MSTSEERRAHWQQVYTTKAADAVSWYQRSPEPSLRMIEAAGLPVSARVIDVGGGASMLADALLDRGFRAITVLDISAAALDIASRRMGARATAIDWHAADVRTWRPDHRYDLWHDRAAFHFLTEAADRRAYLDTLAAALEPGGRVIMATFAEDGPERCSGLPVRRYGAAALAEELGDGFSLSEHWTETHRTPAGTEQSFTWALFRRG
jgi:2-polyprenyl-3-methyl-5-hydroxy-6-metoxy-1,4-benzoquinol methylase